MRVAVAIVLMGSSAAGQAQVDAEAYAAAVARFNRGREARRPWERVIDHPNDYYQCALVPNGGLTQAQKPADPPLKDAS